MSYYASHSARTNVALISPCFDCTCSSSARKLAGQEYRKWLVFSTGPLCVTCSICRLSASSSFPVHAQSVLVFRSAQKDRWFTLGICSNIITSVIVF